ncbi:xanthine dehydrogenase family protein subunit M [Pseudomonadota bacterium]|nr:xanthine dehydrogenase family protein subunit M [Alphaproteobacteria bacterium]MDC1357741.1 xanthine dehydrogenase family protein subunit M [Pseudomonadota bacterium]
MYELEYAKPSNISNAVNKFDQSKDGKYLAGGMTLIPTLKARLASSDILIDLKEANLSNISVTSTHVVIGSMTRHSDVANSADVQKSIPSLSKLAGGIGDHMVRNCGTIGGSVANNDPSACYPSAVLGLGATITTNERELSAEDYFMGMFETALNSNEIITQISFPIPDKSSYIKFPNPASRYAMVGVFMAKTGNKVNVAITGASENGVFRSSEIENALSSSFTLESLDSLDISSDGLIGDIHASSNYRANLIKVMAKRALEEIIT